MKGSPSRGTARKAAIAEAALDLFLERGFGVSIDDVAQVAGASKQTVYKFFGGREGLVGAAMSLELDRVMGPMRAAAAMEAPPVRKLDAFGAAYQQVIFSPECLSMFRYVVGAAGEDGGYGDVFTTVVVDAVLDTIEPLVAAVTNEPAHARELADAYVGTLQGAELNRALAGVEVSQQRLAMLRAAALAAVTGAKADRSDVPRVD